MNRINEIGDTPKGQEMLGRTAERAYQRAARTSGADKQRFMKTYNDAYKTGGKSSNKHLGGTRKHFDSGRDYEYEKWADEHNGNVAESKNMNKKLIRLTEQDLHKIVKESVDNLLNEIGDTPKGQYALGRLAYRKGEQRPRMGQNVGKMRKDSGNDIFKYADKAAHKNGMYGHEFGDGYDYQEDIDNWDNYSKQEKVTVIVSRIMRTRGFNKLVDSNVSIDDMTDEELLDWLKGEQSLYGR